MQTKANKSRRHFRAVQDAVFQTIHWGLGRAKFGLLIALALVYTSDAVNAQVRTFKITVRTANVSGAGTDADVYIKLRGKLGQEEMESGKIDLDGPGDDFERGDTGTYVRSINKQIGEIYGIELGHDDSGRGSGWKPDLVVVDELGDDKEPLQFDLKAVIGGKFLSFDNDGYKGDSKESLMIRLGVPPVEAPKAFVKAPSGSWGEYPTGKIQAIEVHNTNTSVSTEISDHKTATLEQTNTHGTVKHMEMTAGITQKFTVGGEASLSKSETEFSLSATVAKEIAEEISKTSAVTKEKSNGLKKTIPLDLKGRVAIVEFETVVVRRSVPGKIVLKDEELSYTESTTYGRPIVYYYEPNSQEFKDHLTRLFVLYPQIVGERVMLRWLGKVPSFPK